MPRKRWTDEQRADALAIYQTEGTTEAASRTGIPKGTIAAWANRAGLQTECNSTTAKAIEAARLTWELRKTNMADRMGEVAAQALELAAEKLSAGTPNPAKDAATTMAILVDKAQLLAGGATSRNYNVTKDHVLAEARTKALTLVPDAA